MKRTILLMLSCMLIITGLLAAISCSSSSQTTTPSETTPTQSSAVTIQNLSFSQANITVSVGTKVTWTNKDSITHTVTSDTGLFDSGPINNGGTFSYTFNNKGVFDYHCTIHPTMKGTVTVQ